MNIKIKGALLCHYYHVNHYFVSLISGVSFCIICSELVLRLKSDYVWYFYYALFVPFMFHLIIHTISHYIGVLSCILYIYFSIHYRLLDNKRLDPGGVRFYFTMYVLKLYGQLHINTFLQ